MKSKFSDPTVFLLNEHEAAKYLHVGVGFLRMRRANQKFSGEGPKFLRLGPNCIKYDINDLNEWIGTRKTTR